MSEYLSKGSPVFIEGRLKLDTWEGQDGQKRSKLKVVCERMQLIGAKGQGGQGGREGGGPRAGGQAGAATQPRLPVQPSGPARRRLMTRRRPSLPAAATIFRFRFCRTDFQNPYPENGTDLEIRSYHEKANQSWPTLKSKKSEFPSSNASGCPRDRTAASSCCWSSRSNISASRATWSR